MSLDGLRAWIGEVERKLGARTRVFLVLAAIAVGVGGAAIYLALDARDQAVGEDEVQRLQGQIDVLEQEAAAGADPRVSQLEVELEALRTQIEGLQGKGGTTPRGGALEGGGGARGSSADGESNAPSPAAGGEDRDSDAATAGAKSELERAAKGGGEERTGEKGD